MHGGVLTRCMVSQTMSRQLFKMHIAEDINDLLKEWSWGDRVSTGIQVSANDITDQMTEQIEYAMVQDKQSESTTRRQQTMELYKELLYNDILPNKE